MSQLYRVAGGTAMKVAKRPKPLQNPPMAWVSLCDMDELTDGLGRYVEIDGFHLAVFLHEGAVYAMDNHCPHAGGNMAGGHIKEGCAVCPWHGWAFRLADGQLKEYEGVTIPIYRTRLFAREGRCPLVQANLPMP